MSGEQLQPGKLLNDRYRILRVIGKGGMGTVYQAEHVRLDTILAIKEVRAPQTADANAQALLEQCEHEARFLVRLHHPNLPQVTDAFLEDDRFFVVMEYIEGVTLEARERMAGPLGLPVAAVIDWGLQIADVLSYLHSQDPPVIFRDLKPSNVMVEADGRIRLIDFGIARRFQPGAVKDTNLLGSVGYSPPEQFGRHQTDTRTDIYAFGATLHNLLTGNEPSHTPFKFAPVCKLNPAVPEALSRLIDWCLRLDAEARPQSFHEIAMELLAIRDTVPAVPSEQPVAAGAVALETLPADPVSSGPKIILTNPTLRDTGKTRRGSQRTGSKQIPSAGLASDKLGTTGVAGPGSGGTGLSGRVGSAAVASAHLAPAPSDSSRRFWIGGVTAVVALGGLTVWLLSANARHRVDNRAGSRVQTPVAAPHSTDPAPTSPQTGTSPDPPAAAPSDNGAAPITSPSRLVTFDSVVVKGVILDPQGHSSLHIEVIGTAQGQPGDQEIIAAFFYDGQNTQVSSQMPQTPYSSKDGKLSVAATLTLNAIQQPFDLSLDIPVTAFPTNLTGELQFHCVAFFGDQRIGESKTYTPISLDMLMAGTGSQQHPDVPPTGPPGDGTPANPTPSPPGTFGTHRGGD
jgi:serine/threonine protein kinase